MKEDLISIVVPAYNAEAFVEKCLHSLSLQTYQNIEIIVVDDGSTDHTYEVCKEYQKKDPRLFIVQQKNGGLSAARNAGIRAATGSYLMFIDSDDFINYRMVEILYGNLCKHHADISMCDFVKVYDNDSSYERLVNQDILEKEIRVVDTPGIMELLWTDGQQTVIACNKLYKKDLFRELYFTEGYLHEDERIIHRILHRCLRFVYDNRQFYYYLQREEGSLTSVIGWNNIHDSVLAFVDRVKFFKELNNPHHLYKSLERLTKYILEKYAVVEEPEQKKFLLKEFRRYIGWYRYSEKNCEKSYWVYICFPGLYYKIKGK